MLIYIKKTLLILASIVCWFSVQPAVAGSLEEPLTCSIQSGRLEVVIPDSLVSRLIAQREGSRGERRPIYLYFYNSGTAQNNPLPVDALGGSYSFSGLPKTGYVRAELWAGKSRWFSKYIGGCANMHIIADHEVSADEYLRSWRANDPSIIFLF